ncbi:hypothetical protein P3F56_01415 [cyanobacterium endosymbiont of Epithemia clementina EcSB]|nr:hypothetical protein [cyanobacterium endosymbiont of Epithemia clementina EcSB]WGT68414.1 hypothetical protein P3F56_01415 [cyanobacterium endosymbiont of Epithemia clementina EcSB]
MIESIALSRLVISTYVTEITEFVVPEDSGWLIPAGSVEALVIAMKTVLETPVSRLEEMGIIEAKRMVQQHNATQEAQKLHQLFRSVYLFSPILILF